MNISTDKYGKIVDALDGMRADCRENKLRVEELRRIDDDILLYLERNGYCTYKVAAGNYFVRILTEKGYEVLYYMDYAKYRRAKSWKNWKNRVPIFISIIALLISAIAVWQKSKEAKEKQQIEIRVTQLDSTVQVLKDSLASIRNRMTIIQIPTINNPIDTAKPTLK